MLLTLCLSQDCFPLVFDATFVDCDLEETVVACRSDSLDRITGCFAGVVGVCEGSGGNVEYCGSGCVASGKLDRVARERTVAPRVELCI